VQGFVRIQPSLINAYLDYPIHLVHPKDGGFVRFLAKNRTYSPDAVRSLIQKDIPVYIRIHDQKRHSEQIHQKLSKALEGPFNPQKAVVVRDLTLQLVNEFLTSSERIADSSQDPEIRLRELEQLAEYYVALLDMEHAEDLLRLLHKVMSKDLTTATHSINVMILTLRYLERERSTGQSSWMSHAAPSEPRSDASAEEREALKQWALGALLHDIGKVMVPDSILKACRKLTLDEFRTMRMHVEFGWNILSKAAPHTLKQPVIAGGILEHHERTDGKGYPLGLSRVSYPGQVIGILDCFEALTTDKRPYREACSPMEALQILRTDTLQGKFSSSVFARTVELLADI